MSEYVIGILAAFAEPVFHAWANILDNYLSNKLFDRLTPLIFFSSVIGLIVLPFIWFLDPPHAVSVMNAAILIVISLIEILYLYPYFWSLRRADTSVVASLFSLGKIFVPLIAFFLVGERLTGLQYLGFFIITAASVLLALDVRKMKLNSAIVLMLLVSIVLAAQTVLLKYVYEHGVGWGTSIVWMTILQVVIAGVFMLTPQNIAEAKKSWSKMKSLGTLLVGIELLSTAGTLGSSYALYLIPVSVAQGIAGTQPIFALLYAILFVRLSPKFFKEYLGKKDIAKKVVLFVITIVGAVLVAGA